MNSQCGNPRPAARPRSRTRIELKAGRESRKLALPVIAFQIRTYERDGELEADARACAMLRCDYL